ncbi:MAG TPA: CaiB/BaiF CoA-transferase family protein [Gaiellaceae bacterium]|nr:CaiB/BaiF CoA-transferase family protein [Gaiellaceae bacterium]
MQPHRPLDGLLAVDLTRNLPGPYASRELGRLGARVVRLESPEGDPMRDLAPEWDAHLNAGKESVCCDLKADVALGRALLERADIVLEGFRPGVAERLGVGPEAAPRAIYCSITGFGHGARAEQAGHDVNYLGYAGALADTAPALPPVQVADLAAGAQGAVIEILAALLSGGPRRIVVSMTHGSNRFVAFRRAGASVPQVLTGGAAYYRIYDTADGRHLTVGALEPHFFRNLTALIGRPELAARQGDADQEALAAELAAVFATRPLADWLELFDGEDVCAGPVWTVAEAAAELGTEIPAAPAPALGEHTEAWRRELGL